MYASSPIVEIPEVIDGYIVREIGNYCFSSKEVDLSKAVLSCEIPSHYHECSGSDVVSVKLPRTLKNLAIMHSIIVES